MYGDGRYNKAADLFVRRPHSGEMPQPDAHRQFVLGSSRDLGSAYPTCNPAVVPDDGNSVKEENCGHTAIAAAEGEMKFGGSSRIKRDTI